MCKILGHVKRVHWMYTSAAAILVILIMNQVFLLHTASNVEGDQHQLQLTERSQQVLMFGGTSTDATQPQFYLLTNHGSYRTVVPFDLLTQSRKDGWDPHVQMNVTGNSPDNQKNITQGMKSLPDVQIHISHFINRAMVDGYSMFLTCMALVNQGDSGYHFDMSWTGEAVHRSLWVSQLEIEGHENFIARKLRFEPWLNSQAGEYTCYVTVKDDDNLILTTNKTTTVNGDFHGIINSRIISKKFDTSPVKPSKWFSNTNLCAGNDIWQKYADFHALVLSGKKKNQKVKYLVYDCTNGECGGYGNRISSITVLLILAMFTKHVLVIQMTNPVDINDYLLPNAIQWNYTLPEGLKSRYVDLLNGNFYRGYKALEASLLSNEEHDVTKVRLDWGLYFQLVNMSDVMINNTVSTFNLKSQYDVVLLYGCAFNYLFKYQPQVVQAIDSLQSELGLETGKFVALHVRSHIDDYSVFNPLHLDFPFKLMFECAAMAAQSLKSKLKVSKVPIYFTTDHSNILEYVKENYHNYTLVFSRAPIFHVDRTKYGGDQASSQYSSGMIGILSDIEICSRAAVLVRSADSTFSEMMGAIHFLRPQYNLHPFYFYENMSLCRL